MPTSSLHPPPRTLPQPAQPLPLSSPPPQNANLSDVLMDRAVINEANLRNANLSRAIFTRSDLTGADIEGADFTNALVDRSQQLVSWWLPAAPV